MSETQENTEETEAIGFDPADHPDNHVAPIEGEVPSAAEDEQAEDDIDIDDNDLPDPNDFEEVDYEKAMKD